MVLNLMLWIAAVFSYIMNDKYYGKTGITFLIVAGIEAVIVVGILLWEYWDSKHGDENSGTIVFVIAMNCLLMIIESFVAISSGIMDAFSAKTLFAG